MKIIEKLSQEKPKTKMEIEKPELKNKKFPVFYTSLFADYQEEEKKEKKEKKEKQIKPIELPILLADSIEKKKEKKS